LTVAFDDLRIQYQVPSAPLSLQPLAVPADGGGGGPSWVTLYSSGFATDISEASTPDFSNQALRTFTPGLSLSVYASNRQKLLLQN
jgi:hypothetical protein